MFRRYTHTAIFLTTLFISSYATMASAQISIVKDIALEDSIPKSFTKLQTEITRLLEGTGAKDITSLMSTVYTNISNAIAQQTDPKGDQATTKTEWDNIDKGLLAGLTASPETGTNSAPPPYEGGSSATSDESTPDAMYTNRQTLVDYATFHTFDYPYNPDHGKKGYKPDSKAADYLSFDSLLSADNDASKHFIATVLNPQDMPASTQDYLNEQYKNDPKLFKGISLRANNLPIAVIQGYQAKRRRYFAMQNVALSNLRSIQNMSKNDANTSDNLSDVLKQQGNIQNASAITVARLNLMVNIMIAHELKERREIDQRLLGTMSMMLLQNLDGMKQSMTVSTDGSDYKSVKNFIDEKFGIQHEDPAENVTQDGS